MRKIAAVQLLAGQHAFYVWIASKENPADAPSSWFGSRARQAGARIAASDWHGPSLVGDEGKTLVVYVLLGTLHDEQRFISRAQARARDLGLRLLGLPGHRLGNDVANDAPFSRMLCAARDGSLAAVYVALPQDVCQRRSKGDRPADVRAWNRRVLRYERALAVCMAMPHRSCHSVVHDLPCHGNFEGVLMSSVKAYQMRRDVQCVDMDLCRYGASDHFS